MAVWSEVRIGDLHRGLRIDAEFYQPSHLQEKSSIIQKRHAKLGDLLDLLYRYPTFYGFEFVDEGVPVLKGEDIDSSGLVSIKRGDCVTQEISKRYPRTVLEEEDLIISVRGYVGKVGLVDSSLAGSQTSPNLIRVKSNKKKVDPLYLWVFLNSRLGQRQFDRYKMRTSQETIVSSDLKDFVIPVTTSSTVQKVRDLAEKSMYSIKESEIRYVQASRLFLDELGLKDLYPSPTLYCDRLYSETRKASRLDAEFYQPKYEAMMQALESTKPESMACLDTYLALLTNGHTPTRHDLSVGDVRFLTAEHVFDFRVNYDSEKRILIEHHNGELRRTRVQEGDCLFTIKGRIGNAAIAEEFTGPVNINQDVALFRLKRSMPPYYLMAYLNSPAGKAFTEQYCTGQINPFLGLGNIKLLPIPLYEPSRMEAIAEKARDVVLSARAARDESLRLLEEAKQIVQQAVMKGDS